MIIQLSNGDTAELPDGMTQEQMTAAMLKLHPVKTQGQYSEQSVPDSQAVTPSEYGTSEQYLKPAAGLQKSLDLIGTSTAEGMLEFTGRALGAFESVLRGGDKPITVPGAVDYWKQRGKDLRDKNEFTPLAEISAGAGKIGSELLTTSPLGPAFKWAHTGAQYLPRGLKTVGEVAGGGALLSGLSGLQVGEDTRGFSPEQALAAAQDPMSYIAPGIGVAAGGYLKNAAKFGKDAENVPGAIPRYTRGTLDKNGNYKGNPWKTALHIFYDSLPMLTHMGRAYNQKRDIGDTVAEIIKKISHSPQMVKSNNLTKETAKIVQMGYQKLKAQEDLAWNSSGFLDTPILNQTAIKDAAEQAKILIEGSGAQTSKNAMKNIDDAISNKKSYTVEDVRNLQSVISDAASDAFALAGGTGYKTGKKIAEVRDNLFETIQGSLGAKQLEAFGKAKAQSKGLYELGDEFDNLKDAVKKEATAVKIVDNMVTDSYKYDAAVKGGLISKQGQQYVKARTIADALFAASEGAVGINLNKFAKAVAPKYDVGIPQKIMSETEFGYVKGLADYMRSMKEADVVGVTGRLLAIGTGFGIGAGIGVGATSAAGQEDWGSTAAVITYPAMLFASNHPVLKKVLGLYAKKLSPSALKHVQQKVQEVFTKTGFFINNDGALDKEETK